MRILFIVQGANLHAARWVNQFAGMGWDIHIADAYYPCRGINPEYREGTFHTPVPLPAPDGVLVEPTCRLNLPSRLLVRLGRKPSGAVMQREHEKGLASVIDRIRPDIIHLLGLGVNWHNLGLPVLAVRDRLGGRLPAPWIYSSWGTDLEIFGCDPIHAEGVTAVLRAVDGCIAECERDRRLAFEMGFDGTFLGFFPAFGGTDITASEAIRQAGPVSDRKLIVIKGRDRGDPIGRAMTAMKALALCHDELTNYRIAILQATDDVREEALMLNRVYGLDVVAMPRLDYANVLRLVGASRAYVAMTANDGLPSSLIEAMALGACPVHSDLEPIREWIVNGENGFLVPSDDPEAVAAVLRRVLTDDDLVEDAARRNSQLVRERLDAEDVKKRAVALYEGLKRQI